MNFLHYSNQSETLVLKLAELLRDESVSPFQKDLVLIGAAGMKHYLSLAIAKQNGVCSGVKFYFLSRFLKELLSLRLSTLFPFDPKQRAWLIWNVLSSSKVNKDFLPSFLGKEKNWADLYKKQKGPINDNKQNSAESLLHYHFAYHLANLFDRYLLYVPEWRSKWQGSSSYQDIKKSEGGLQFWQFHIWEILCQEYPELDLHAHLANFFALQNKEKASVLPKRIFVFCISSIEPLVEEILLKVASSMTIDVHWFFLEPGPQALQIKKESRNALLKYYNKSEDRLAKRVYFQIDTQIKKGGESSEQISELCQEAKGATLLKDIQRALYANKGSLSLHLAREKKLMPLPRDNSLCIQSCHSPLREVEVLHDWLLEQFQNDSGLEPEDIIVMSPHPDLYAPFVEGVFSRGEHEKTTSIPYNLRDTRKEEELSFARIFFKLTELGSSRFEAEEIFAILSDPWILRKTAFSMKDLELIRQYISSGAICWGLDARHRSQYNLKAEERHTFKEGFLRLFLSYALPPNSSENSVIPLTMGALSPVLDIEGENARILGDFADFVESLAYYAQKLSGVHKLSGWAGLLSEMEEELLGTTKMLPLLKGLHEMQKEGAFTLAIDIAPVRLYLEKCQKEFSATGAFTSSPSGVQFVGLSSMRSIPCSILCLLGMNENDFPRREANYEFDLFPINAQSSLSQNHQDRLLFLELLLSARSQLYISYVGQSQHRPSESFAPSTLVNELGAYIDRVYRTEGESSPFSSLVQKHSIYGFSQIYFSSPAAKKQEEREFFSYEQENCKAAQALRKAEIQGSRDPAFLRGFPSDEGNAEGKEGGEVQFQDFLNFFKYPTKTWLEKNLELFLTHPSQKEMPPTEEPLALGALENYKLCMYIIKEMLVHTHIHEKDKKNGKELAKIMQGLELKAQSHLPHGNYGTLLKTKLWESASIFSECVRKYSNSSFLRPLDLDFDLTLNLDKAWSLGGKLEAFSNEEDDLVFFSYGNCKAWRRIEAWISYLVWLLSSYNDPKLKRNKKAYLVCKDKYIQYDLDTFLDISLDTFPLQQARLGPKELKKGERPAHKYLSELLSIYLRGLAKPLCYFNESSWAYAEGLMKKKSQRRILKDVQSKWYENFQGNGESQDSHTALCFRQRGGPFNEENTLSEEFQELSLRIWGPILAHSKTETT